MGVYNKTIITNAGINAITQAIAESQTLAFKTAKTSSYAIPDGTNIRALTSLRDIVQSVELPTPTVYNSNTVQVYARFSNTNIATEYYINTIGVYASLAGGAEFLFAVLTAITPDRQPVFDENSPTAFIYNILMRISDAANVVFAVNDTGTATVADINHLQNLIDGKVNTIGGNVSGTVVNTPIDSADPFPIPAAGDSIAVIVGKIIKFFADILNPFTGATNNTAGEKGIVPAPAAGDEGKFLRGDSTWTAPTDMVESFTSSDVADGSASSWTSVNALASGETNRSIFGKVSMMFRNIRYLYKVLGTTDISSLGNGTVTGAIEALNTNKTSVVIQYITYRIPSSIPAYGFYDATFSYTAPNGYNAIGITWITKAGSNSGNLLITSFAAGGGGRNIQIGFYNNGPALAGNTISVNVNVLFRK